MVFMLVENGKYFHTYIAPEHKDKGLFGGVKECKVWTGGKEEYMNRLLYILLLL
jgi:hypothetical protein